MKRAKQLVPEPPKLDYRLYQPVLQSFHARRLEKLVFGAEGGVVEEQQQQQDNVSTIATTIPPAGIPSQESSIEKHDVVYPLYSNRPTEYYIPEGPSNVVVRIGTVHFFLATIIVVLHVTIVLIILIFVVAGLPRYPLVSDEESGDSLFGLDDNDRSANASGDDEDGDNDDDGNDGVDRAFIMDRYFARVPTEGHTSAPIHRGHRGQRAHQD